MHWFVIKFVQVLITALYSTGRQCLATFFTLNSFYMATKHYIKKITEL